MLLITSSALSSGIEGTKAPNFTLKDLNGNKVMLSKVISDGPVLLDFWATWCNPCKQALPLLDEIQKKYKDKGFKMYAISIDNTRSLSKVKPYIKSKKYSFEVLYDTDSQVLQQYRGTNVPHTVLIGTDGQIKKVWIGYHPGEEVEIEAELKALLGE